MTAAQRDAFERDGYLRIDDALTTTQVEDLTRAVDRVVQMVPLEHQELAAENYTGLRNCIVHDSAFLDLLDLRTTVPLVAQLLGPNIQLLTSHLIVRSPDFAGTPRDTRLTGWHRDGGTAPCDLFAALPRLSIKVGYWLTDATSPDNGGTLLDPGSHLHPERAPCPEGAVDPPGVVQLRVPAGTAVLVDNRTAHAVGPNLSDVTRKTVFIAYGFRWMRPMDYERMPADLLQASDPVRRQLLGEGDTPMDYQLPDPERLPLYRWLVEHGVLTPVAP